MPPVVSKIAMALPPWHLAQIAFKVVGYDSGHPLWLHIVVLAAFTVVFFSLSHSKLVPYALPVFPPLALLVGRRLAARRGLAWDAGSAVVLGAGLLADLPRGAHEFGGGGDWTREQSHGQSIGRGSHSGRRRLRRPRRQRLSQQRRLVAEVRERRLERREQA